MPQGWESPDGTRSVAFARGIAAALRARTLEAFRSVPKRGAEVGGLLFGRVLRTNPFLARITGFEEIPSEHRFGPSYILSEEDQAYLEKALQRERPEPVIGFFRSYTGREMLLDEADRNLLTKFFSGSRSLFLLLEPRSSGECFATFLFPEANGEIGWEPQYPSFDLVKVFNGSDLPVPEPQAAPQASPQSAPPPQRSAPPPKMSVPRALRTAILEPESSAPPAPPDLAPPPAPETTSIPLGVPLTPADEVPPDAARDIPVREPVPPREPVPVREPVRAREPLPAPVYAAREDTGSLEPERPRRRGFLLPLVAWILLCIAAAAIYELWSFSRAPRWTPLRMNAQVTGSAIDLAWDASSRPVRDASRGVLTIEDNGAEKRVDLTPQQIRSGRYTYATNKPANVLFRLQLSGDNGQAGDSLRVVSVAPPAAAQASAPPPRQEGADRSTAEHDIPPPEPRPANLAVLPEPTREIHPEIPPGIRARIHERIVIPVEVKVTANGRVTSASARGSGDSLYHYLADRSTRAARQWRFSPARSKAGRPVAASRTVYFVFAGQE